MNCFNKNAVVHHFALEEFSAMMHDVEAGVVCVVVLLCCCVVALVLLLLCCCFQQTQKTEKKVNNTRC